MLAVAVGLSGCFKSDKPLITPAAADHPLAAGTLYDTFSFDISNGTWSAADPQTVSEDNGYVIDKERTLLKSIGGGYFVSQTEDPDTPTNAYKYNLVRIDGGTVLFFDMECEQDVDAKFVVSGAIDESGDTTTCKVSRFDGLVKVFRDRIAHGLLPRRKYVRHPGG